MGTDYRHSFIVYATLNATNVERDRIDVRASKMATTCLVSPVCRIDYERPPSRIEEPEVVQATMTIAVASYQPRLELGPTESSMSTGQELVC